MNRVYFYFHSLAMRFPELEKESLGMGPGIEDSHFQGVT